MNNSNTVVNASPANVVEYVLQQEPLFSKSGVVKWEKESQFAIQQLTKNKFLNDIAWANLPSLQNAIINVSAIGISLNPANKHAYLVPRDKMVCLDISYMGLMHLAITNGAIVWGQAKLVYANDDYKNAGIDKAPIHTQDTFGDKGAIIGAYCTVKLKGGDYLTEEMDIDALNKIKGTSKAQNGPWKTFPEEMMRKTVVKRASKYWPACDQLNKAVDVLNEQEGLREEMVVSAPETESYSADQKEYLDMLITKEDALGVYVFRKTISEAVFISLYHSFPRGEKGKYQKIVNSLESRGRDTLYEYTDIITTALDENDHPALFEATEELSANALQIIKESFSPEHNQIFNQMSEELK